MISEKMQKIFDIINDAQVLSNEELTVLQQRLVQQPPGFVVPYHQIEFDMFPNTDLLNKFIKFISYQDSVDSTRLSNVEGSIEDRIIANTLKEEIIAQLQNIKS